MASDVFPVDLCSTKFAQSMRENLQQVHQPAQLAQYSKFKFACGDTPHQRQPVHCLACFSQSGNGKDTHMHCTCRTHRQLPLHYNTEQGCCSLILGLLSKNGCVMTSCRLSAPAAQQAVIIIITMLLPCTTSSAMPTQAESKNMLDIIVCIDLCFEEDATYI